MNIRVAGLLAVLASSAALAACADSWRLGAAAGEGREGGEATLESPRWQRMTLQHSARRDLSPPLAIMAGEAARDANVAALPPAQREEEHEESPSFSVAPPARGGTTTAPTTRGGGGGGGGGAGGTAGPLAGTEAARRAAPGGEAIEQTDMGTGPAPELLASFEGLGESFEGPQGRALLRNPSDNSLAVGPDHVVVTVNSRMAIFTKKGAKFSESGRPLYGPVNTNNVFRGFGVAGQINNGDAVVRYDQLADRWLVVMPIFRRLPPRPVEPPTPRGGQPAHQSMPGVTPQPGDPALLEQPPALPPTAAGPAVSDTGPATTRGRRGSGGGGGGTARGTARGPQGSYAICYAVSTTSDPLGSYYRYEFVRPLFPDYPRPAIWPDGYYVPTSTGDAIIEKHAYVVDRAKMLNGEDATEQGFILDGVNFLNNCDLDGKQLPPPGAPNIMLATGGSQLRGDIEDDGIYAWKFFVNWSNPSLSRLEGPAKIPVAPYTYLGGGQLTNAVPQPGTTRGLDSQGDKLMSRVVYRRIGDQESIVAVHSINTSNPGGGGGVRWYEFRLDPDREVRLYQQGTYCPGGFYRWMGSPAMDAAGNIGIGYTFGGPPHFAGQRFAGRRAGDPLGKLTLRETVLVEGEAAQSSTLRWQDYTATAVDPSDDMTIWYVGDYLKAGAANYSSRIGAFRLQR